MDNTVLEYWREKFAGNDNYGKPKQAYVDKVAALDDEKLHEETKKFVWLSAYAANNPRSDYHWMVDACYYEWLRRENPDGYSAAYDAVVKENG